MSSLILTVLVVAISTASAAATVFRDEPRPALVGPGVVSTLQGEYSATFDSGREELVFMRRTPGLFDYTLVRSRFVDGAWTPSEVLPISGVWRDAAPYFAPDGDALFFDSARPTEELDPGSINVWRATRSADGWSEPELLRGPSTNPPPVNGIGSDEFGPAVDNEGRLWVYTFRQPFRGGARLVSAGFDDSEAEFDPTIPDPSAPTFVGYMYLDPGGRYVVLEGRSLEGGDTDLYCSCRLDDGQWGEPLALEAVNTRAGEGGPWVTGDGGHLLFTSDRPSGDDHAGSANLWSIPLAELGVDCLR